MDKKWIRYLSAVIIAVLLGIGVFAVRGGFLSDDSAELYKYLSDAFFIPGILFAAFALLMFVAGEGIFNIFGFSVIMVILPFLKKNRERDKMTYFEYCQSKAERKSSQSFLYLGIIGIVFIALALFFTFLWYTGMPQ